MTKSGKHCGKRRNFFFCPYVFKELSAAEESESVLASTCGKGFIIHTLIGLNSWMVNFHYIIARR